MIILLCNFRYITPEKFYVEALGDGKELLVIDRVSQELSLQGLYFFFTNMMYVRVVTGKMLPICGMLNKY
jgi:hypothetical protein